MSRITPSEALQRVSSASLQGMRLAPAKDKKAVTQPEFVGSITEDGFFVKSANTTPLYLFNNGKGGLVLPAYDDVEPILGDAEQADFTQELPPHVEAWLTGYADEINWLENGHHLILNENVEEEEDKPMADEPKTDIPYMVKSKWGQKKPFNSKLVFDGTTYVVGCPAVMAGQLIKFWGDKGYHRGCTSVKKYQWKNGPVIPASEAITKWDYANLANTKPTSAAQIEAVATLLAKVGFAFLTEYGTSASGAYTTDITKYIVSRLRMGNVKYISCDKMGLQAFTEAVYKELAEGRPCGFRAKHTSNGSIVGSHAFICDGYRVKDSKFHFNFGWTGSYDGWYAMSALNLTKSDNYTADKGAWIGIKPEYRLGDANRDGRVNVTDAMVAIDHSLKNEYDEASDVNSDGKVTASDGTRIVNHILGKDPL